MLTVSAHDEGEGSALLDFYTRSRVEHRNPMLLRLQSCPWKIREKARG